MKVTREEWLAARERLLNLLHPATEGRLDQITEAALGPCPPEPAPADIYVPTHGGDGLRRDIRVGLRGGMADGRQRISLTLSSHGTYYLEADAARDLIEALDARVRWLREHGDNAA